MNAGLRIFLCFFFLTASLVGCSSFSSTLQRGNKQYLQAESISPLKIPPGTSSDAFYSKHPVSNKNYSIHSQEVSIIPPGLY